MLISVSCGLWGSNSGYQASTCNDSANLYPHKPCSRFPFWLDPCQHSCFFSSWKTCRGLKLNVRVAMICMSVKAKDANIFSYDLLAIHATLETCLLILFAHLLIRLHGEGLVFMFSACSMLALARCQIGSCQIGSWQGFSPMLWSVSYSGNCLLCWTDF